LVQLEDVLRAIAVIASGMAAGLLTTVLFVITPLERSLDRSTALRIKNAQDSLIDKLNPPMVVFSVLAGLALLVFGDGLSGTAQALTGVGVVGVTGIGALSVGFNFPLNRRMYAMSEDEPPPEFEAVLARWTSFHIVRTALGMIGFVAFTVAALPGVA
jgi:uncharacterized membrane protein